MTLDDIADHAARAGIRTRTGSFYPATHATPAQHVLIVLDAERDFTSGDFLPCARLTLSRPAPDAAWDVSLDSLAFHDDEAGCALPADRIMRWLRALWRDGLAHNVSLTDVSRKEVHVGGEVTHHPKQQSAFYVAGQGFYDGGGRVSLSLTSFRKFSVGQGWYEKYGFVPADPFHERLHHESFALVRASPIDRLALLLYSLVRACLVHRGGAVEMDAPAVLDPPPALAARQKQCIDNASAVVAAASYDLLLPELRQRTELTLARAQGAVAMVLTDGRLADSMLDTLQAIGMSADAKRMIEGSPAERQWLDAHVPDASGAAPCACAGKLIMPSHAIQVLRRITDAGAGVGEEVTQEVGEALARFEHVIALLKQLHLCLTYDSLVLRPSGARKVTRSCKVASECRFPRTASQFLDLARQHHIHKHAEDVYALFNPTPEPPKPEPLPKRGRPREALRELLRTVNS